MRNYDLIIIGGGPAGMAAAVAARNNKVKNILIIERDKELGGILNQCIHNGFGLHHFKKELTGPEYSELVIQEVQQAKIAYLTDTMVLHVTADKVVHAINSSNGYMKIQAKAIVLAMGCRERTRGAIRIHGSRAAGIYTAGTAQRLINRDGYLPGNRVVILGSGDIGLVMARRMTLEGAKVEAVLEILPYSNGLTRNIVQCLDDYNIPLLLSHTVTRIHGEHRVTGVTIAKVDSDFTPIEASARFIPCDTLLLSVGLIPENEISRLAGVAIDHHTNGPIVDADRQTNIPGIFACGNVLQVHDLVDFVSEEGSIAGLGVAKYLASTGATAVTTLSTLAGTGIGYVVPHRIVLENVIGKVKLFMRVKQVYTSSVIQISLGDQVITRKKENKFLPAEMVCLEIDSDMLRKNMVNDAALKIEVVNENSN